MLTFTDFWALYAQTYAGDLVRYMVGATGVFLVVNLALAGPLAGRKIRRHSPSGWQIFSEILASMRTVFIFALAGALIGLAMQAGWIHIPGITGWTGWVWTAVSFVLLGLLHDTWFYWMHFAMHRVKWLRRIHVRHHLSYDPSPFTSYSFNISEAVGNALFLPLALLLVPATAPAIFIFVTHMMLRNALGHCGYEVYPAARDGKPLFDWMTTTTHHDMHHARPGGNFGLYFTWWDRWMDTEHANYHAAFAKAVGRPPLLISQRSVTS